MILGKVCCRIRDEIGFFDYFQFIRLSTHYSNTRQRSKVKNPMNGKRSCELKISLTTIQRILKEDFKLFSYKKKVVEPYLTDTHETERKKLANVVWISTTVDFIDELKRIMKRARLEIVSVSWNVRTTRLFWMFWNSANRLDK